MRQLDSYTRIVQSGELVAAVARDAREHHCIPQINPDTGQVVISASLLIGFAPLNQPFSTRIA